MPYRVLLHEKVRATLDALPTARARQVKATLARLAEDPFAGRSGVDVKKLKGTHGRQDLYRVRVGELRAVFAIEGRDVLVTDLFRRGEGYDV